jgi:hypothetical protein
MTLKFKYNFNGIKYSRLLFRVDFPEFQVFNQLQMLLNAMLKNRLSDKMIKIP